MNNALSVKSEIGKLRKVLLHRPSEELSRIIPDTMEDLLFDEIPHLTVARAEHDVFADVLRGQGVEVVYTADLATQALKSNVKVKYDFVSELVADSGVFVGKYKDALVEYFLGFDEETIIKKAMHGLTLAEVGADIFGKDKKLGALKPSEMQFITHPMPNLYFARDPMATIGNGVAISHMRFAARNRETIFTKYIFRHHPDYAYKTKFYYKKHWAFPLEGGDILNLSDKVLAIGVSQRTYPAAIEFLAQSIFADDEATIDTILVFQIPNERFCMHLDTIFTQVDHNKFVLYAETMLNIRPHHVIKKKEGGDYAVEECDLPLDKFLAKYLELDTVELIRCGGNDSLAAAREQWNDAANTLAVAPGVVVCYNRNEITNEIMRNKGITVLEVPSAELSRGRGGPRCMSMPLIRE
ncbi:MAG: arginine deiminase [Defluviitaleaceae bacterium]|nr:arginine deiminase [Defluviitaleaceae bacterium]